MTTVGALAAAMAVLLIILSLARRSTIDARLRAVARVASPGPWPRVIAHLVPADDAETTSEREHLAATKLAAALLAASVACIGAWLLSLGPIPVAVAAYAGFVVPSLIAERRERASRREAERGLVVFVEWLHALVVAGRPLETAIITVAAHGTAVRSLDASLSRVARDYALGVPMSVALIREGERSRLAGLGELAARIVRARDLGRGILPLLADLRDDLRASERAASLRAASQVEGKLTAILALCYLPALALLVMVPLFLTLLNGLFG